MEAVQHEDRAAEDVDGAQDAGRNGVAEGGDAAREREEPQARCQEDAGQEGRGFGGRQGDAEGAEEHRAVQNGLRIHPGDDTGFGNGLAQRGRLTFKGQRIRDLADHAIGHVEDEQRTCAQNDRFEPGKMIQQAADAVKTAQRQTDVEEQDDERCYDGAAQGMG